MGILSDNTRMLRGELGRKIGSQMRIVPELNFLLDSSLDYAQHIEDILKK
jgi:ribosome-binding factor A